MPASAERHQLLVTKLSMYGERCFQNNLSHPDEDVTHTENRLSWKRPTRIPQSNSWPCTESHQAPKSIAQTLLELCQAFPFKMPILFQEQVATSGLGHYSNLPNTKEKLCREVM